MNMSRCLLDIWYWLADTNNQTPHRFARIKYFWMVCQHRQNVSGVSLSIPNMENSGSSLPWLLFFPAPPCDRGCLGHNESWYIRISVCSVKSQVYTLWPQRKGLSVPLLFIFKPYLSHTGERSTNTYCKSKPVCCKANTHLFLYNQTKWQPVSHLKAPSASECTSSFPLGPSRNTEHCSFMTKNCPHWL